jgi:hypothetical protein
MARTDDEREIRLRPPKPCVTRNEGAAWSHGFKLLMHYARSSRMKANRAPSGKGKPVRPYHQRCAIRVTYLKNKIRGQWRAHGRYIARESAGFENDAKAVGFSRETEPVDIAGQLASWQVAGDQQMWKIIVSPEFGDKADLPRLTRELLVKMEKDLGTDLEWVAAEHHNTEHPHVHVVIRGVRDNGDLRQVTSVEGRVLVHGQDEQTGRNYLMLEGTDAKVHFIQYTPEMEEARSRGELRTNSFVRLRRLSSTAILDVWDLGEAENLLKNSRHLSETAHELLNRGSVPTEDGWGGWLGQYQTLLRQTALEIEERSNRDQLPVRHRRRDRSPDRGR